MNLLDFLDAMFSIERSPLLNKVFEKFPGSQVLEIVFNEVEKYDCFGMRIEPEMPNDGDEHNATSNLGLKRPGSNEQ